MVFNAVTIVILLKMSRRSRHVVRAAVVCTDSRLQAVDSSLQAIERPPAAEPIKIITVQPAQQDSSNVTDVSVISYSSSHVSVISYSSPHVSVISSTSPRADSHSAVSPPPLNGSRTMVLSATDLYNSNLQSSNVTNVTFQKDRGYSPGHTTKRDGHSPGHTPSHVNVSKSSEKQVKFKLDHEINSPTIAGLLNTTNDVIGDMTSPKTESDSVINMTPVIGDTPQTVPPTDNVPQVVRLSDSAEIALARALIGFSVLFVIFWMPMLVFIIFLIIFA